MTNNEGRSWAENRAQLRLHAEDLIRGGTDKVTKIGGGALGVEALALLYRRASDPDFAADALKLLHELQTHQVELDLLLEQLQTSEIELAEELAHYQALYRFAPAACLVVSRDGRVIESNAAAVALLGCTPEHSEEQTLTQYLAPPGRGDVADLLERLKTPGAVATCKAWLAGNDSFELSINASLISSGDLIMIVMSHYPAPHTPPARS
ncbi:PAS domain-containing protein [Marinobacter sp. M216]|uniref:PAS domain-containing protein n=1 Tax=Marinobacter albus TaxID=3030833 RepID=A0ABT7HF17_9GAMM|nr:MULTISPECIES: PAS domain-containing protein [unclassified Marinobacter]MBW7472412.1 PAS domain-containing protein [Marinobacter sp. F4218]MDK9558962.1 PAS domain-containing protein [Marinobacter sp. M216]